MRDGLMGLPDISEHLGIEYMTLWRRWRAGAMPEETAKVNGRGFWSVEVIDAWAKEGNDG